MVTTGPSKGFGGNDIVDYDNDYVDRSYYVEKVTDVFVLRSFHSSFYTDTISNEKNLRSSFKVLFNRIKSR